MDLHHSVKEFIVFCDFLSLAIGGHKGIKQRRQTAPVTPELHRGMLGRLIIMFGHQAPLTRPLEAVVTACSTSMRG